MRVPDDTFFPYEIYGANDQPGVEVEHQPATKHVVSKWVFPKIGVSQNGWFIMENPIKMDDLGVPLFLETSKCWS